MFSPFQKKKNRQGINLGFSLIELMVTMSVIILITGIVMAKYSSFNNVVILKSQSYELALDIREAQVFGVGSGGASNLYGKAYGIYIDLDLRNSYVLFQDASPGTEFRYDAGEKIGETYTIDSRFEISQICATVGTTETCVDNGEQASIAFKRPDFDARLWSSITVDPINSIAIVLTARDNNSFSKIVRVYSSGQISVE